MTMAQSSTHLFTLRIRLLPPPVFLSLSIAVGLGAALALAWFMYFLINASEMRLAETTRNHMLDFVRVKREEAVTRKDRKPQRPQVDQVPDAPPTDTSSDAGQQLAVNIGAPATVGADFDLQGGLATGDGDYMPIVKVAPIYPRNALSRGISGECVVQYNVTTAGTVKDVEVVKEQCTQSIFARSSIEAAKRFKYKPRIVDGEAIEVRGVRNIFYFEWEWASEQQPQ